MNKHSKYRPLQNKVKGRIMNAEIGVTGVYQVMLETLDEAETAEAALREELAALRAENELLNSDAKKVTEFHLKHGILSDEYYGHHARRLIGNLEGKT
tara:strand:+ start:18 stop:311 length:294 start_codon:yes stop_codon:yes gene_type:complete